jgi:hypothetical protein
VYPTAQTSLGPGGKCSAPVEKLIVYGGADVLKVVAFPEIAPGCRAWRGEVTSPPRRPFRTPSRFVEGEAAATGPPSPTPIGSR